MHGTAYRLTESDEDKMRAAIGRAYREWCGDDVRSLRAHEVTTLERIAAHAIGCSVADLRDVEMQWIACEIGELQMGLR